MTDDYWISVDDIDCIPRLIERLEKAVQKPREEYIPAIIIFKAILYAFKVHFGDRNIPVPYEFHKKVKVLSQQLDNRRRYFWH